MFKEEHIDLMKEKLSRIYNHVENEIKETNYVVKEFSVSYKIDDDEMELSGEPGEKGTIILAIHKVNLLQLNEVRSIKFSKDGEIAVKLRPIVVTEKGAQHFFDLINEHNEKCAEHSRQYEDLNDLNDFISLYISNVDLLCMSVEGAHKFVMAIDAILKNGPGNRFFAKEYGIETSLLVTNEQLDALEKIKLGAVE